MIKNELGRLFKSKSSMIILILLFISCLSFWVSFNDRQMFIGQLAYPAVDLNLTALRQLIANYTGIKFVFDFWFVSDFFIIFNIVVLLWIGIFLSANLQMQRENGMSNIVIIRTDYKKYLNSMIVAQTMYIFSVIFITTAAMTLIAVIIAGVSFDFMQIGLYQLNIINTILTMIAQVFLMSAYFSLINAICLVSNVWIQNKYLIQALPLMGFVIAPLLLGSTLGNLSHTFAAVIINFVPTEFLTSLEMMFQVSFNIKDIVIMLAPLFAFAALLFVLYRLNLKKYTETCL